MIYIIGAGPAGSYTAYLLAKAGKMVQLFEKNKEIGKPIQCTGLVTETIKQFLELKKEFIKNKISKVKVNSKNNSTTFTPKTPELVLDREKFDKHLSNLAVKAGAKLYLSHKFIKKQNNYLIFKTKKGIKKIKTDILTDILIGADGPGSNTAKLISNKKRKYILGMQAILKLKTVPTTYQVFLGKAYGIFSWVVPETKSIARVGTLSNNPKLFKVFLTQFDSRIIEHQAGPIPIYKNTKLQKDNIYLVGDAASQVKNSTGGGIIYGLSSAKILANSIIKNKNYQKEFNKKLKKELTVHKLINKILKKFKDKDYDILIKLCSKSKIKKIIETADREKPLRLLLQLFLAEPRFIIFSKKLFW